MDDETQTTGNDAPADEPADTADTQDSEADVQTNNETPEATPGAEEKEAPEVKAEDTVEDKLYAGKYKSVEELEKAYTNAESKLGKETSEKAELTRILNEAFAAPEPPTGTDTADDSYEETTTPQVNPEIEQLKVKVAIGEFTQNHPDADTQVVNDILKSDPYVASIQGADAKLEYAYLRSQNIAKPKAIAEAKKAAQEQTQAKAAEKQAAQVESAGKSEPVEEESLIEKATGNYTREERDAARRQLIKKQLVDL